jgi:hypothetical protein
MFFHNVSMQGRTASGERVTKRILVAEALQENHHLTEWLKRKDDGSLFDLKHEAPTTSWLPSSATLSRTRPKPWPRACWHSDAISHRCVLSKHGHAGPPPIHVQGPAKTRQF